MGQKIFIIENHFANKMVPYDGAAYSCNTTGFQVAPVFWLCFIPSEGIL